VPTVFPVYHQVVEALTPILRGRPGIIVTIDGRDGVGKTTLGRYLNWHFNVTLVETDLFLIPAEDYLIHLDDQVNRIIERRVTTPRPVIVEGISILQLMQRIHRVPGFAIYVANPQHPGSRSLKHRLAAYEAAFDPVTKADFVATIEP
jgi:uridine kinase